MAEIDFAAVEESDLALDDGAHAGRNPRREQRAKAAPSLHVVLDQVVEDATEEINLQAGDRVTPGDSGDTHQMRLTAVEHQHPYKAIIDVANNKACDLIMMASHGWRGISAIVLGSETLKVLTHSTIPVLVYRGPRAGLSSPYFAAS